MPRNETEPLKRVHLHLYARDVERLEQRYGGPEGIGISKAARAMIRKFLDQVEATAAAKATTRALPKIEIPEEILTGSIPDAD